MKNTIENTKNLFEQKTNTNLSLIMDSRTTGASINPSYGHYCDYSINRPSENSEPLIVSVYENGSIQFSFEGSYYPTLSNTQREIKNMQMFENPVPTDIENISEDDFQNFVNKVLEFYA